MGVPLDDLADAGTITLTTETPRQVWGRVGLFTYFGVLTALMNLILYMVDAPWTFTGIGWVIAHNALTVFVGLLMLFVSRGTWLIDPERITFHPCHRRSRSLRWSEVERVRWNRYGAAFRGADVSIRLHWRDFPTNQRKPARRYIEKLLATDFALSVPERALPRPLGRADLPNLIIRWIALLGFGALSSMIWLLGMLSLVWMAERFRGNFLAHGLIAGIALGWMVAIFLSPFGLAIYEDRAERQPRINPGAWRPRLTKPARPVEDLFR